MTTKSGFIAKPDFTLRMHQLLLMKNVDIDVKLYYYFFACDAPLVKWHNGSMVRINC